LLFCIFVLNSFVSSSISGDVPVMIWSSSSDVNNEFQKMTIGDAGCSEKLAPILDSTILTTNPEIVVFFVESQLRTFEVSAFNSPTSVFRTLQEQVKKTNALVIPFGSVNTPLYEHLSIKASKYFYFTGERDATPKDATIFRSLSDLDSSSIMSNGRVDILVIILNRKEESLEEKFRVSGNILQNILEKLKGVSHVVIYSGRSDEKLDSSFTEKFYSLKRDLSSLFSEQSFMWVNMTNMTNITGISNFNYWFPGWFWNIAAVIFTMVIITSFGTYHLLSLPVTERLNVPSQNKKAKGLH